ncbi:MAG: S8 family serine peptidase [Bacteroidota bacterium]
MKQVLALFVVFLLLPAEADASAGHGNSRSSSLDRVPLIKNSTTGSEYLAGVVLIKLKTFAGTLGKSTIGVAALDAAMEPYGVRQVRRMFPHHQPSQDRKKVDLSRFVIVEYSSPVDPASLAKELGTNPAVEYAEPKYVSYIEKIPNDSLYWNQWHLPKIQAPEAWDITQGSSDIVIAIVDSGTDWNHPDLSADIWINPGDTSRDGIDNDNNGYVDDVVGWDFSGADFRSPDNDPSPGNPHGTHVAGIASAVTDNALGVAGVGFQCRLMPVKTTSDTPEETLILFGYEGIVYAADNGADVINCSWGSSDFSQVSRDIIQYATDKGSLVVGAAGNESSSADHYPSGYPHALSVASVGTTDKKSSFTNFGTGIDVTAPGETILSTVPNRGYQSAGWSGTSMAAPIAAGIAALVKTIHTDWTPDQIGEQVRISADPIDDLNTSFRRQLGFGRVNAFRALTVGSPSVRLTAFSVDDAAAGNGDGIIDPGENIHITVEMTNYLQSATNTSLELTTTSSLLTIQSGSVTLGPLGTLESQTNALDPFVVTISPTAAQNSSITLTILISDGGYNDYASFGLLVSPTFRSHDINNIVMTVTSKGTIAFDDYPNNTRGDGFIFRSGNNLLFEAAFMAATGSDRVVDVARDETGGEQRQDFQALQTVATLTPGTRSDQETFSLFSDENAGTNKVGLKVGLRTYAYQNSPDDDYIVLRYALHNTSGSALSNLYAGLYFDWDLGSALENSARWDSEKLLGYVYDVEAGGIPTYVGVTILSHSSVSQFRAISNPSEDPVNWGVWDGFTKQEKWIALSSGVSATLVDATDASYVIGVGPLSVNAGDSVVVSYAVLASDDRSSLRSTVDAARAKWDVLSTEGSDGAAPPLPITFKLYQNYPNPFNPSTVISYDLPGESYVRLSVYNMLGELIDILVDGKESAGRQSVEVDAEQLSSGVYFYRLETHSTDGTQEMFLQTRKMVVVQ